MLKHKEITSQILAAYYEVYNILGYGFLEKVYEKALYYELSERGLKEEVQQKIAVFYKEKLVGDYFGDLIVEDLVIVELKAEGSLHPKHDKQLWNYLKATNTEVGLLVNFGEKPEFRRNFFANV